MKLHLLWLVLTLVAFANDIRAEKSTECSSDAVDGNGTCSASIDEKLDDKKSNSTDVCEDANELCPRWAEDGECLRDPDFMFDECGRSCYLCIEDVPVDNEPCIDKNPKCQYWEKKNECVRNAGFMIPNCRKTCKACATSISHSIDFGVRQFESDPKARAVVRQSKKYMRQIMSDPKQASVREMCRNGNEQCSLWASKGACKNPALQTLCAPACQSCEMVDVLRECNLDPDTADALQNPGDLTRLFEAITNNEEFSKYEPSIIYRPFNGYNPEQTWSNGPWFMEFEKFLADEEISKLLEHAERRSYGRSEEVSIKPKVDGSYEFYTSSYRTSYNTWCDEMCEDDPVIQGILKRVADITGLPQENAEPFQLLRYEKDQRYAMHHDYIGYHKYQPCGVRILTFFFYLNDDFEGGGTNFQFMHNMTVVPKKGKAVLWTNVLNKKPNEEDQMLDHQALPVTSGVKYAANLWLHQRDFKNSLNMKC